MHGLHPRGADILEELFPGLTDQLVTDGAVAGDILGNSRWLLSGQRFAQARIGQLAIYASRPFIEGHVRARVRALPAVSFRERCDIVGLTTTGDRRRVTGVQIHGTDGEPTTVGAELVIDATGRGSRTPLWLGELGYLRPPEDRVDIGLGYATRTYRLRPGAIGDDVLIVTGGTPHNPRMGLLATLEGGRHVVTLAGILGDYPPIDPTDFASFAGSIAFGDVAEAITNAEPLDDGATFRFPASVRHRHEWLRRFPNGLLVIGDAMCSFNPVYGQGMTVAALQAINLRRALAHHPTPPPLPYFRHIAKAIDSPWDITVGADLAFPAVAGTRTTQIRLVNAYLPRLHAAASTDTSLAAAFIRVMGLRDRPESLLRPDHALRVWRTNRRERRGRQRRAFVASP